MDRLTTIFIVLLLTACSAKTHIHFYTNHLSKDKVNEVISAIDKEKFEVTLNSLPYPNDINDNAIVYSPSTNSRERLNTLMEVLSEKGFNIATASLIAANNHSFTENNLGLYLFPDDYIQSELSSIDNTYTIPLVNEYGAIDCQHATVLYLKEPDEYIIEINKWDDEKEDYQQEFIEGKWKLTEDDILHLNHPAWQKPLIFQKSNFRRNEIDGESKGVKFTPLDKVLNSDMFSMIYSDKAKAINCTYSISLAL